MDSSIDIYHFQSPAGVLELTANDEHLLSLKFLFSAGNEAREMTNAIIDEGVRQLNQFFNGEREKFDLPLKPVGTEFQRKVWDIVAGIPLGGTLSYVDVARRLGDEKFVRSVGAANGRNPYHIIVPCHRVIGANGDLVGYAGGIDRKRWLLDFEKKMSTNQLQIF